MSTIYKSGFQLIFWFETNHDCIIMNFEPCLTCPFILPSNGQLYIVILLFFTAFITLTITLSSHFFRCYFSVIPHYYNFTVTQKYNLFLQLTSFSKRLLKPTYSDRPQNMNRSCLPNQIVPRKEAGVLRAFTPLNVSQTKCSRYLNCILNALAMVHAY